MNLIIGEVQAALKSEIHDSTVVPLDLKKLMIGCGFLNLFTNGS